MPHFMPSGEGAAALSDLDDVNVDPEDLEVLTWDADPGEWVAVAPAVGAAGWSDARSLAISPGGDAYESIPNGRFVGAMSGARNEFVNGQALLVPVYLPAGITITNVTWSIGTTGATLGGTPKWWFALCNSDTETLRSTAVQTGAVAATEAKTVPLSSPVVTAYEGIYYIAGMFSVTTPPTINGFAGAATDPWTTDQPLTCFRGNTSMTDPVADGTDIATAPSARLSVLYAYVN